MQIKLEKKLFIKETDKYGKGVFANSDIKKGTILHTLDGEIITFEKCIQRIKSGVENQTDSFQVGLELDMDLDEISRIFNHSCNPTGGIRKTSELFALRNIKAGEEITYDYSATVGPNIPKSLWQMKCLCQSKNCRKTLGNVVSIPQDQLNKYIKSGALQDYIIGELARIKYSGDKIILPKYRKIII